MRSYVAELYTPRCGGGAPGGVGARARAAALALSADGTPVRFLRSILVPSDETCFLVFESDSADAVWEATRRASLVPERVVEAVEEPS